MGEPQIVEAEPDELEEEVDLDNLHPPTLQQESPWFISIVVNSVISGVVTYGWSAVGFLIIAFVLWLYMEPKVQHWQRLREQNRDAAEYHKNPDKALARERAIHKARQRMQEEYNSKVLDQAKEREENGQEDKDSLQNTTCESSSSSAATSSNSSAKPSGKPRLRPEYNPLTGDAGSRACGWRGRQRGVSGGG